MLPEEFTERMKQMLQSEYEDFVASYDSEKYQALRLNPLKGQTGEFFAQNPFTLTPVPWTEYGYYYTKEDRPGKHPYHDAGVYYIQEPSAMAPAEYLAAKPGEYVLDLCAAPGGKSTQIAAQMQGEGILISNEIHPARAKILSENMERMGVKNAIVTNETPEHLSEEFPEYFDRIMVDAPCSGEGMFRKNEDAVSEWSLENVAVCAKRQDGILDCAADMLKAGGRIVYSTCTFAPDENEGTISRFLKRHPEFVIEPVQKADGMSEGRADWTEEPADGLAHTIRLFPHHLHGEGHYLAVLKKKGNFDPGFRAGARTGYEKGIEPKEYKEFTVFCEETLRNWESRTIIRFGEQLYELPKDAPALKGLKVLRPGLHLGTFKKNRFEPSHALALALCPENVYHTVNLSSQEKTIADYINGQTFSHDGDKGWYLITVDGYSIGWGKSAGGTMKNHYPKGLRHII